MPALLIIAGLVLLLAAAALAPGEAEAAVVELQPGGAGPAPGDELQLPDLAPEATPAALFPAGAVLLEQLGQPVTSTWELPARGEQYRALIVKAEEDNGLPPMLLGRTLYEESRFRPDIINGTTPSSAGALGIAQFMPKTAQAAGIDPLDPNQAIPAAARELRAMFDKFGSWTDALAAYNWGQGNLGRKGAGAEPAETKRYVKAIAGDVGLL